MPENNSPYNPPNNPKEEKSLIKKIGLFSVIITSLIGYTGAGIGIGYYLWVKDMVPWWVMVFISMLGLTVAMIRIYEISEKNF